MDRELFISFKSRTELIGLDGKGQLLDKLREFVRANPGYRFGTHFQPSVRGPECYGCLGETGHDYFIYSPNSEDIFSGMRPSMTVNAVFPIESKCDGRHLPKVTLTMFKDDENIRRLFLDLHSFLSGKEDLRV